MNTEWKLVPVEPTDEMEVAAENDYEQTGATFPRWKSAYAAMLNAAPPAPTSHPIPTGATGDAQPAVNWAAVSARVAEYAEDYELYGEDDHGREGTYTPNETERGLIIDAIHGLLADDEFMALMRPAAPTAGDALDVLLLTQALQDLRQAFVIAVGDKSPFARIALEKADSAIAQQSQRKEA